MCVGMHVSRERRSGEGRPTPAQVQHYLKGATYPKNRQELVDQAKKNNAPSDVVSLLSRIDDRQYRSPAEVSSSLGKVE